VEEGAIAIATAAVIATVIAAVIATAIAIATADHILVLPRQFLHRRMPYRKMFSIG
jgi:hypothetical protein